MLVFLQTVMARVLLLMTIIKMSVHQPGLQSIFDIQSSDD